MLPAGPAATGAGLVAVAKQRGFGKRGGMHGGRGSPEGGLL
jgi:hypothetical protein